MSFGPFGARRSLGWLRLHVLGCSIMIFEAFQERLRSPSRVIHTVMKTSDPSFDDHLRRIVRAVQGSPQLLEKVLFLRFSRPSWRLVTLQLQRLKPRPQQRDLLPQRRGPVSVAWRRGEPCSHAASISSGVFLWPSGLESLAENLGRGCTPSGSMGCRV